MTPYQHLEISNPKLGAPEVMTGSPSTFIFTNGDFGVTDGKFGQGFASCQQATEDQDGTALLLYLWPARLSWICNPLTYFLSCYTPQWVISNLTPHCTE